MTDWNRSLLGIHDGALRPPLWRTQGYWHTTALTCAHLAQLRPDERQRRLGDEPPKVLVV